MKIIYDHTDPMISFGVEQLRQALKGEDIFHVIQYQTYQSNIDEHEHDCIVIRRIFDQRAKFVSNGQTEVIIDESFVIRRKETSVYIEAAESRGIMYGCLELADLVARGQWASFPNLISQKAALGIRGIKYNLPYAPYAEGDPFTSNEQTCMDMNFWSSYLDMLALNRYNCLSLWSEHPFHLMVVSPVYRATNPFSDEQAQKHIEFFRELFAYAKNRGIDVYLFTWNIRILPEVAMGLGLPAIVGEFDIPNRRELMPLRQSSDVLKQYFEEMIYRLLITYPDLKGLGTSASEHMYGSGIEKEEWVVDTYIKGIKRSGRNIPFIHRTNMQNAGKEIKELVQPQFDKDRFFISWKYSNAHAYSHPEPQFEKLWNAWEGIDLEQTQILYTVRNDDVHAHRWGDPDYVKAYVKGMLKPYVKGFYWGADSYVWGTDFQHVNYGHKAWKHDFEKHLLQFQLWGRLSYNPDLDEGIWEHLMADVYGKTHAGLFLAGLQTASKIIPAVNRLFWINYDYQWHPEICMSRFDGFKTILHFVNGSPMPGTGVMSIQDYVTMEHNGSLEATQQEYSETPPQIIRLLLQSSEDAEQAANELERKLGSMNAGQSECTLLDLRSMAELGRYYACKFTAALELNRLSVNGSDDHRGEAVRQLEQASKHWERVGHYWSRHNQPFFMPRVQKMFGYPFYLGDVFKDIEMARTFNVSSSETGIYNKF